MLNKPFEPPIEIINLKQSQHQYIHSMLSNKAGIYMNSDLFIKIPTDHLKTQKG